MSVISTGRPKKNSQSRDLRREILLAAKILLTASDVSSFSMREVSRIAKCTHQAPYHYFSSKESLIANLITTAFDKLADVLSACNDKAEIEEAPFILMSSGIAYVNFAIEQRGIFRLMFRPDICSPLDFPLLLKASIRARSELERLNYIVHADKASAVTATALWAHIHGLAVLVLDGPLSLQLTTDEMRNAHIHDVGMIFVNRVFTNQN